MSHAIQTAESAVTETGFNMEKAQAFTETLAAHYNSAAITLMLSIGHRTCLLDTMGGLSAPATSLDIAKAADLNERYVREWLAALVTGRIVEFDPLSKTYWLPADHAASLTRGAPLGNWAVFAQGMPIAGSAQDEVIEHFEHGGGTHYHDYPGFHDYMAEASAHIAENLELAVLPLVPGLKQKLEAGIDVLDVGCGKASALIAMAEKFPSSRFTGYDFSDDALAAGRKVIFDRKLKNIELVEFDMTDFGEINRYDFITTFDAVHDQKHPQDLIRGIRAALKPGGIYLMQDIGGSAYLEKNFDFAMAPFLYAISVTHCMAISLGQDGEGLGTMWGWETAQAMLEKAGFGSIKLHRLETDPLNVWFVSTRD